MVRHRRTRTFLAAVAVLLPGRLRRAVHVRLLGYEIHPDAHVGRAFVDVDRLRMAEGSSIGSLTAIRGCEDVELGPDAVIGILIWINAVRRGGRYFAGIDRHPAVILGRGAMISCLHLVDACAEVVLEEYAAVAGFGSQLLTHSIDIFRVRQDARPITIGRHAMVGTSSVLLPGATVPQCSVVSAGSVVDAGGTRADHHLYGGVPAVPRRALSPGIKYFHRTRADVL